MEQVAARELRKEVASAVARQSFREVANAVGVRGEQYFNSRSAPLITKLLSALIDLNAESGIVRGGIELDDAHIFAVAGKRANVPAEFIAKLTPATRKRLRALTP